MCVSTKTILIETNEVKKKKLKKYRGEENAFQTFIKIY